ncbi:MAG: hypothetical protein HGA78_01180 [Nitrospirales bacterium]|nr:hypothetical protein [Nitrospirales bacterium]
MDLSQVDWTLVFAALFAASEGLAQIPRIRANSIFQLIYGLLKGARQQK